MSGPKSVTFYTSDYKEVREVTRILRGIAGVEIQFNNGNYSVRYTENQFISIYELRRRIQEARKQAQENIRYTEMYISTAHREMNVAIAKNKEVYEKNIRICDEAIRRLQQLKDKCDADFHTPYISYDCSAHISMINDKIREIEKEKAELAKKNKEFEKDSKEFLRRVDRIEYKEDISQAERARPSIYFKEVNYDTMSNELEKKVQKDIKQGQAYADELIKIAEVIKGGELARYDIRFIEKVKQLNPFDPNSLKEIKDLLNAVIEEEKFLQQERKNQQVVSSAEEKVNRDLEILKEISKKMETMSIETIGEQQFEDSRKMNEELLQQVNDAISSIKSLDYLSRAHNDKINGYLSELEYQKNNISSSEYTAVIKYIIDDLTVIGEEAVKNNEKYQEFIKELEEYNSLLSVLFPDEENADVKNLGGLIFDADKADEYIAKLKESNAFLKKTLTDIHSRAYIGAAISVLEDGTNRVFSKEQTQDSFSCTYVRKETPGVIYEMKTEESGACLYPRGVILHNGKKMISAEELKEVHHSCGWAEEIEQKLLEAGYPPFRTEERQDAIKEEIYLEENYYRMKTYEESYRYLEMIGFSEQQIIELIGRKDQEIEQKESAKEEENKAKEKAIAKEI